MMFSSSLAGRRYRFDGIAALLAAASAPKTGDALAGIAAENMEERVAARHCLADLPLSDLLNQPAVDYDADEVTRILIDWHNEAAFAPVASLTVGGFRDWLLGDAADTAALAALAPGLTPEMVAAVSKVMRNQDLMVVAAKCRKVTAFRSTLGLPGTIASRLQPNHPTDDLPGILASTLDGLLMASGDAVVGINPASDNVASGGELLRMLDELRQRFAIPIQTCVLSHVTTTIEMIARGDPVDLVFQSIGGTEATNRGFGVTAALLHEAREAAGALKRGTVGNNVMYLETGQGSSLSSGSHHGVDQQTLEARAYGLARTYDPLIVNNVVGFIGPEYIDGSSQIMRAGLEDMFCGKLLGLPMGTDVCYTNHAAIDQDDIETLATLLGVAGANFLIAVPGGDDVMLGYQSLSFHSLLVLRQMLGLRPAPEFEVWLRSMDMVEDGPDFRLAERAPGMLPLLAGAAA